MSRNEKEVVPGDEKKARSMNQFPPPFLFVMGGDMFVFLFFLKGFNLQDWTSLLMVKARISLSKKRSIS